MSLVFKNSNFDSEVLKSNVPVLVDFYADWCGPCKMMSPVVDELAKEYEGKVKIGKLNVDNDGEIAQKYKVMSIPTMLIIKNGEVVDQIVGAVPKQHLQTKLDEAL